MSVSFEVGEQTYTLHPAYLDDWIDLTILDAINGLISRSGRQFVVFQPFDQTAFVMALTAEERSALEQRGWCFL